jgi:protein-disulfide isomerase
MATRQQQKEQARAERLAAEQAEQRAARRRASIMRLGLVLALAVVVVVVAIVLSSGGGSKSQTASSTGSGTDQQVARLFRGIPQQGVHLGKASSPTLIEFADLQCPYCGDYARQAMPSVIRDYVRTGRLRYELRLRSFLGPDSVKAAGAAAAATRANRLYQFSEVFYRRQQQENTGYVTDGFLRQVAGASGVDAGKAVAAAHHAKGQPLVEQAEQMASRLGSQSTPDFFLRLKSGRLVPVRPADLTGKDMAAALDQALGQT